MIIKSLNKEDKYSINFIIKTDKIICKVMYSYDKLDIEEPMILNKSLELTCENCKAGFCALCLENCGDAHNHLQQIHGVIHDYRERSNFKKANYKRTTDELIKIYEMISIFIVNIFKDLSGIHECCHL
jgi:hypothetical protein